MKPKILLIYTGGTIGMVKDATTGALHPFDLGKIYTAVPVLSELNCKIDSYTFSPIIDSSNMNPKYWLEIAQVIEDNYHKYNGFVVLHGTDTMAYTASALSFLLENLNKPVILTGSQLPLGMIRTDGFDNIIGSVEIAMSKDPVIPEVCIYFQEQLFRGNRTSKVNSEYFEAFLSPNYPPLAKTGIHISYNKNNVAKQNKKALKVYKNLNNNIAILKLYPGIQPQVVESVLNIKGLEAVIMETYGSGNAPTDEWFLNLLAKAANKGIIIYNVTQCNYGAVQMGHYETSSMLGSIGVISGFDITTESAVGKLMFLLGNYTDKNQIKELLATPLRGEITNEEN